ncbi:RF-1 domain-containing protein [Terrimicrobium sacchariphilum]|jgi:peptide chain release factor|uniref:RF-1 domain-containing protein n=1 Tax=Terrimicrobium sacchariphilum TaxID=690879 RepID=A0A146G9H5_TERSA|nr:peptide chain release factor-like protein [Terrimicrobium sacchariphilum]GAT33524.1 RF-1 domain-containing protein [Terrimicrobium sacchariphilum]
MAIEEKLAARLKAVGIRPEDITFSFTRSSGPGGQHVNKVSTAVELLHVPTGTRIVASDSRSQSQNRHLAIERFIAELERRKAERRQARLAAVSKARRQKAKRSRATKAKMVEGKRRRGETKKMRGRVAT